MDMRQIPRRPGRDPDAIGQTEADHFGNRPICGAFLDMRDLGQMPAHVHDQPIEVNQGDAPPARDTQ
jgi:hypothetical protein